MLMVVLILMFQTLFLQGGFFKLTSLLGVQKKETVLAIRNYSYCF